MILQNGKCGEVYNVGGNNEKTNIQVVKHILKELTKPDTLIKYVTDRKGHDLRYAIDASKLENDLGWKPMYNFESGIRQTIHWYLDNKSWWENIINGEYQNYLRKMYLEKGRF